MVVLLAGGAVSKTGKRQFVKQLEDSECASVTRKMM